METTTNIIYTYNTNYHDGKEWVGCGADLTLFEFQLVGWLFNSASKYKSNTKQVVFLVNRFPVSSVTNKT